ncbi:hypothetical protein [Sinomonas flava]|uniref:hypothetical protein n=1 Tax=Sinomonas flava TaxID=496857 RepID=UPI0031DCD36E
MARLAPALLMASVLLVTTCGVTACGGGSTGPVWTGATQGGPSASGGSSSPGTTASASTGAASTPSGSASASGEATPSPAATSAEWKTYTDPGKTISFDLPAQWIVQTAAPAEGASAGSLNIEVKTADGSFVAALKTGLPVASPAPCDSANARSYTVLNSVPVDLPFTDGPGVITPRFVFRVIQGYKFFGSFGLTGVATAAQDGKACQLMNIVPGPPGVGGYSFADVTEVTAPAPSARVAPLASFDSLAQASDYVHTSAKFADAQRMIMSLKFTPKN